MNSWVHRARRLATGLAAIAMALLYLAISTQLAFPLHESIEAAIETESVVQKESLVKKEAFACALHKCGCKNAEQCRTSCCCFPKASRTHSADGSRSDDGSHGHGAGRGEDHMTQYQSCNGPEGHDHGLPPLLSAHLLPRPAVLPDPEPGRAPLSAGIDRPLSPISEVPQKIPI